MSTVVLSVGQCGFDHSSISRLLTGIGATAVKVDLHTQVDQAIVQHSPALILINRINDSDGSSGIELIGRLKGDNRFKHIPLMLVSNFQDAQEQAIRSGAAPGFGKSQINSSETIVALKKYLN